MRIGFNGRLAIALLSAISLAGISMTGTSQADEPVPANSHVAHAPRFVPSPRIVLQQDGAHVGVEQLIVLDQHPAPRGDQEAAGGDS